MTVVFTQQKFSHAHFLQGRKRTTKNSKDATKRIPVSMERVMIMFAHTLCLIMHLYETVAQLLCSHVQKMNLIAFFSLTI